MSNEWLKNLKVGDKVIVVPNHLKERIETVDELSNDYVYLSDNERYRRSDGNRDDVPREFPRWIEEATPERLQPIEHRLLYARIRHNLLASPDCFTYDQLQRIAAIINEPKPEPEPEE